MLFRSALAARVATAWPRRVSPGLVSAVEMGRATSVGSDAQPATQTPRIAVKSSAVSRATGWRAESFDGALDADNSAGLACMMHSTVAQ